MFKFFILILSFLVIYDAFECTYISCYQQSVLLSPSLQLRKSETVELVNICITRAFTLLHPLLQSFFYKLYEPISSFFFYLFSQLHCIPNPEGGATDGFLFSSFDLINRQIIGIVHFKNFSNQSWTGVVKSRACEPLTVANMRVDWNKCKKAKSTNLLRKQIQNQESKIFSNNPQPTLKNLESS